MKKLSLVIFIWCFLSSNAVARMPEIGAEVWIEPVQTQAQIDEYFRLLAEYKMTTARLFIMWNQIEKKPGVYDFSRYDFAFAAAQKYQIKVVATLTPAEPAPCRSKGSFYEIHAHCMPEDENELLLAADYIQATVNRYKDHPALEYWWLTNEPGNNPVPSRLALMQYRAWLQKKYDTIDLLNESWFTAFSSFDSIAYHPGWDHGRAWFSPRAYYDRQSFWIDFQTWFLKWVADEIKKHDPKHPLTSNPHALFTYLHRYDFAAWRKINDVLGASIHPSWHLTDFTRAHYPYGIAGCCDLVKGKSNANEFWVSELQAGPNLGGRAPLCPDSLDLAQWVWTSLARNAKRIIYWSFNPRRSGTESGEWSILGFGNTPSDRVLTSKKISETILANKALFAATQQIPARITLITTPESQFIIDHKGDPTATRNSQAVFKSYMAWHRMFMRLGLSVDIREAKDYEWDSGETGRIAIFSNVFAVPAELEQKIYRFVATGNKIIADGFSFQFDEKANFLAAVISPYEQLLGAKLVDLKVQKEPEVFIHLNELGVDLPAVILRSEIVPTTAAAVAGNKSIAYATRNKYGKGEVLYLPQVIGPPEFDRHSEAFAKFVLHEVKDIYASYPIVLENLNADVMLQTLVSGDQYLSVLVNCTAAELQAKIRAAAKNPKIIWGNRKALNPNNQVRLQDRETLVIVWDQ